ncbi:glycosyltransferase family 4 protein [Patescibacteria group bacterium]|nr:glycosyltransferase family 4 protein [Patescibacteria group bacterium]
MPKKRVLIFVPKFPVLSETFIERDISALIELGDLDISVVYMELGSGAMSKNVKPHVFLRRLTFAEAFLSLSYFIYKPKRVFEAYKLVMGDRSKSVIGRFYLFLKSIGYTKVFESFKPQEIHVHFMSDPSTMALVAATILDLPFSINAHARDITEYPTLAKEKAEHAKFISICNSSALTAFSSQVGDVYRNKIHLVRHCIDETKLFASPLTLEKPKRLTIISGGARLEEKKGHTYLISAAKLLKDSGVDYEVHITGGGSLYPQLLEQVKDLGLENNVFIHGGVQGVSFDLISQYYRIADILVLPSLNLESGDADGIPNSLVEAAFAKVPIITTDAGSIKEFLSDGISGIIVSQKRSDLIADAIKKVVLDAALREKMVANAYRTATTMFGAITTVQRLNSLLQS